jgi:hypothetical protein
MTTIAYKQQQGFEFETKVNNLLIKNNQIELLREADIVRKYNNHGIDHILVTQNYTIFIQDKWKDSKPPPKDIDYFIATINRIKPYIRNKNCIAIFLSKMPLSPNSENIFNHENNKGSLSCISFDSFDMDCIIVQLARLLYKLKIYCYEKDGDTIMLGTRAVLC